MTFLSAPGPDSILSPCCSEAEAFLVSVREFTLATTSAAASDAARPRPLRRLRRRAIHRVRRSRRQAFLVGQALGLQQGFFSAARTSKRKIDIDLHHEFDR